MAFKKCMKYVRVCLSLSLSMWLWQNVHDWQQNQWIKVTFFFLLSLVGGNQPANNKQASKKKRAIVYRCERCQFRWNNLCKWHKTHRNYGCYHCWLVSSSRSKLIWTYISCSYLAQFRWGFFFISKTSIQYWQWHFVCVVFFWSVGCYSASRKKNTQTNRPNSRGFSFAGLCIDAQVFIFEHTHVLCYSACIATTSIVLIDDQSFKVLSVIGFSCVDWLKLIWKWIKRKMKLHGNVFARKMVIDLYWKHQNGKIIIAHVAILHASLSI